MPLDYTASGLVASVRRRAYLPSSGSPTTADILATLNEEMQDYLVPLLLDMNEEYLVAVDDQTTVASTAAYDVPSNSVGRKLRDVQVLVNNVWKSLDRISPLEAATFGETTTTGGYAQAYYLQSNSVILCPTPGSAYTLRLKYYRRPDQVVSSGFSAFSTGSGTTTYTATVASTTGMAAGTFTLFNSDTYALILEDLSGVVTNATTLTLTVSAADATTIEASEGVSSFVNTGDIPCLVPQIPYECVPLLEQRVACMILQAKSDSRTNAALAELERSLVRVREMIAPRTDGRPEKYVSANLPGRRRLGYWGGCGSAAWIPSGSPDSRARARVRRRSGTRSHPPVTRASSTTTRFSCSRERARSLATRAARSPRTRERTRRLTPICFA